MAMCSIKLVFNGMANTGKVNLFHFARGRTGSGGWWLANGRPHCFTSNSYMPNNDCDIKQLIKHGGVSKLYLYQESHVPQYYYEQKRMAV